MDGVGVDKEDKVQKMGATSNPNSERLAALQEKKKSLEEALDKKIKELRELCTQEADLTGIMPPEMPLEPGESLPMIRRRVGTAYQLPDNFVKIADQDDSTIPGLELQIQIHMQLADAARDLAFKSKTLKKQHISEYQNYTQILKQLREKLATLKEREQQMKQKKKSRVSEQDDNISVNTMATSEPFVKSDLRQSLRSLKPLPSESSPETRYSSSIPRHSYRNSDTSYLDNKIYRQDDAITTGLYGLSLNGYQNYIERREGLNVYYSPQSMSTLPTQYSPHYQQHSPQLQHNPHFQSSHSFHQRSPQQSNYPSHYQQDFVRYSLNMNQTMSNPHMYRQSSPNSSNYKGFASESYNQPNVRQYQTLDQPYRNPHQIQPHQQYEQTIGLGGCWRSMENGEMIWCSTMDNTNWEKDKRFGSLDRRKNRRIYKRISPVDNKSVTNVPSYTDHVRAASVKSSQMVNRRQDNRLLIRTQSLGSVGAQTIVDSVCPSDDNSSCNSDNHSISEINHNSRKPKEKEWVETSLDGPISPTHSVLSHSQSTLSAHSAMASPHSALPSPHSSMPSPHSMLPQIPPHAHQPPVPPPPTPPYPMPPSLPNAIPHPPLQTILSPDEKYMQPHVPPPLNPKPPLEIPAESNKSPRILENNIEMFNNNVPENCTVVQQGYEETKPFEMSDFYKYSTKYKKSPVKAESDGSKVRDHQDSTAQKNLSHQFEEHKTIYQPDLPAKPSHYRNSTNNMSIGSPDNSSGNINNSLNLSQITVSDNFSAEMNAWYKEQNQIENNNSSGSGSKSRSTATLV
ncbi:histone-lysine N-methyltransferase SETD1B isoform X2 [Aethina tumida]|uniref:histone-lysine N-methyltransferase SETD1B isoform X2 n=1 Tax=Aethina tumida TaxID=116153 RepID=UPI00096B4D12|nr:histone-lysine N-methyltransferase SETD1B isoform X2 [Aethina tumida]